MYIFAEVLEWRMHGRKMTFVVGAPLNPIKQIDKEKSLSSIYDQYNRELLD